LFEQRLQLLSREQTFIAPLTEMKQVSFLSTKTMAFEIRQTPLAVLQRETPVRPVADVSIERTSR
jgi:hypothetical protein